MEPKKEILHSRLTDARFCIFVSLMSMKSEPHLIDYPRSVKLDTTLGLDIRYAKKVKFKSNFSLFCTWNMQ